ncbi:MAG TPA: hypothetical protein VFF16_03125 [Telluria sp.]|nr:hypothetical protein [Telluria sp.]
MKPTFVLAALLAASVLPALPAAAHAYDVDVVVRSAPPAPRFESVPPPRYGFAWAPGYWNWTGRYFAWMPGHWEPMRPGYQLVGAQWIPTSHGWVLRESSWQPVTYGRYGGWNRDGIPDRYERPYYGHRGYRDHDRDHDGIADRYDRDRDNDGTPNRYDRDRDGDGVPNRYDRHPDNRYRNP